MDVMPADEVEVWWIPVVRLDTRLLVVKMRLWWW